MSKSLICSNCKQEFTWDGGNDNRGNIYICEQCNNPICISCMMEYKQYKEEILSNIDGIAGLERILCLECYDLKCNWCGEVFEESELEMNKIGKLCFQCKKALKSRGEEI